MSDLPVNLTSGIPETVLPAAPPTASAALEAARALSGEERRVATAAVVADYPRYVDAWADLGSLAEGSVEAYAYYRVGYHRGLDALRGAGWRGSGYVRRSQPTNVGFLDALDGLGKAAATIGEQDEVERIRQFLVQLDPDSYR